MGILLHSLQRRKLRSTYGSVLEENAIEIIEENSNLIDTKIDDDNNKIVKKESYRSTKGILYRSDTAAGGINIHNSNESVGNGSLKNKTMKKNKLNRKRKNDDDNEDDNDFNDDFNDDDDDDDEGKNDNIITEIEDDEEFNEDADNEKENNKFKKLPPSKLLVQTSNLRDSSNALFSPRGVSISENELL